MLRRCWSLGLGLIRVIQVHPDCGKAAGGFALARMTGREVWGSLWDSGEGSGIGRGSCQAQVGLMYSSELHLRL